MAEPLMEFDIVVRREHHAEFVTAISKRLDRLDKRRWVLIYTAVFGVSTFLATLFFFVLANVVAVPRVQGTLLGPGEVALLAYLSSMLITLALYQFLGRRYNAFRVERSLREVGGILGPGRVTLDEESITAQGPPGRALTWWSAILEMSEASNTYLLWTDPGAAIMVPKDAFKTAAECAAFETLVAARIAHGADRHSS